MASWLNSDGLYIKYGQTESATITGGEYAAMSEGSMHYIEFEITPEVLNTLTGPIFLSDTLLLPGDCFLFKAEFEVEVAFDSTGEAATVDFGLYDTDRTTAYDEDGIDAAIAEADIDAVGDTIACNGALVGTRLANNTPCYVTADVDTELFTAGLGRLKIWYYF
jgi:hypothetical protein